MRRPERQFDTRIKRIKLSYSLKRGEIERCISGMHECDSEFRVEQIIGAGNMQLLEKRKYKDIMCASAWKYVFKMDKKEDWPNDFLEQIYCDNSLENVVRLFIPQGYKPLTSDEEPQNGDIVMYVAKREYEDKHVVEEVRHVGIYEGGKVRSLVHQDREEYYLALHDLNMVSLFYGKEVIFFRKKANVSLLPGKIQDSLIESIARQMKGATKRI